MRPTQLDDTEPMPSKHKASATRSTLRPLLLSVALLGLSPLSWATPEKAAKFYEDALQRFEAGDLAAATIQLKNTIQQDQKMLAAHLLLGKVLLASGELKAAEAAFEEALKQGVSRSEVALPLGQLYLLTGERRKLLEQITLTGMPQSQHAEILTLRGSAYAAMGNTAQASKSFADARALDPRAAGPWAAEAPMLLRMGEAAKARAAAQKASELAPKSSSVWYTLGTVLYAVREDKAALAAHEQALALNPRQVDARVARASILLGMGRDKDAERDIAQLREWKIVDPRAAFVDALLASRRGDAAAAKASFAQAAELVDAQQPAALAGNDPLLMAGALSHQALGNSEKAKAHLETLLTLNPKHFAAQVLLGSILLETREYGRAAVLLEGANRAAPDDAQVLMLLGSLQMARKRYQLASELFEKAASKTGSSEALRELAFSQLGMGQGKLGTANLEKSFASNPGDARAGVQLAMHYINQGQAARALQTAETIVKKDPGNLTMLNFLGNIKGRTGDKAGARQTFQQTLSKDPGFRPALVNLNWLDIEEKRFDDARQRLKQALSKTKEDPELLFQLGVLEIRAGRPTEALEHLQLANDVQRKDPRPGLAIIDLNLSLGQTEPAIAAGRALSGKFPNNPPVQLALGRAYLAAGDQPKARALFQEVTRIAEFDAAQQVHIGRLQLAAGSPEAAAYNVEKALQADPNDLGALVLQVELEARRGDAARTDAALKALNSKHAGSVPALLSTAQVAMMRKQFPAAQAAFRQALDKAPSTGTALLLVRAMLANGESDKALALLEAQVKKQSGDRTLLKALAEVQTDSGKNEAATKSFNQLLASDPNDSGALNSLALLQQSMGQPQALATIEKAVKLAPGNPDYIDSLGWILAQRGNFDQALRHLRDARLRKPDSGSIRFHLAYALAKTGRKAEAREELSAALRAPQPAAPHPELNRLRGELGL